MTKSKKNRFTRLLFWFWGLFFSGILLVVFLFFLISNGLFGNLPDVKELENPKNNVATEIISSDEEIIGKFFIENRTPVKYKELSPYLIQALVATEDERFFEHSGIDIRSLARAVIKLGKAGGGSTITQQLAKMLFTEKPSDNIVDRIKQKLKEWVIAVQLERRYTKEEIIAMYFNKFDFLYQAVGINSAAKIYFKTTPDKLTLDQAATLVGMAKNPVLFNPVLNEENNLERRNVVFQQMERNGYLSPEQKDSLILSETKLHFQREDHNLGIATYFREQLRLELKDWCEENGYDLYRDGLKIYVTLDSRMQNYAEEAVKKHLSVHQKKFFAQWKNQEPWGEHTIIIEEAMKKSPRYQMLKEADYTDKEIEKNFNTPVKMTVFSWDSPHQEKDTTMTPLDSVKYYQYFLQTGFMSFDPHTGEIKAWVGGIDHRYFKYDHVNINSTRQVGSTFKPFVYTMAVDNGYSPCFEAPNEPVVFEDYDNWTPKNADGKYGGTMQLRKALALSVNSISAYLMKQLGPNGPRNVIDLARKMGIKGTLEAYPSICLGTMSLSVYEMIGAFGTFANKGVFVRPFYIKRIEDKNGVVVYSSLPETQQAMSEQTAYVMLKMMERATFGTAARLRYVYNLTNPIACKTGTTQNQSDGWFIGVTPNLVSGGWVGNDHRAVHFKTLGLGGGSAMSMPIWAFYMQKVYADKSINLYDGPFEEPSKPLTIEVDCDRYQQPHQDVGRDGPLGSR
ncbi:MAG: penicillin-binding protein [Bacteroidetes bacterium]|nr:penicillin-binding protein [Bacteroidota bacterium]